MAWNTSSPRPSGIEGRSRGVEGMWGALSSWTGFQLRPCREWPVGVRVGVGVLGVKQLNDASGSQAACGEPVRRMGNKWSHKLGVCDWTEPRFCSLMGEQEPRTGGRSGMKGV